MTLHVCRDFLTRATYGPSASLYLMSIFTYAIAGFSIVGHTNLNLSSSLFLVSSGSSGSLNLGVNKTRWFEPEFGVHSFDHIQDVHRILVLKSNTYPMQNTGLYRVTSVNSGSSSWTVDYRSPDSPPPESGSLRWWLFKSEGEVKSEVPTFLRDGNAQGSSFYHGSGSTANNSRIIFQSPTSASWQVRYCLETVSDLGSAGTARAVNGANVSIAPGFGGTTIGDYQIGGEHLHGAMFFNTSSALLCGGTAGLNPSDATGHYRFYAWFQDTFPGNFIFLTRDVETQHTSWAAFGFCEDESLPAPPRTIQRMFVLGNLDAQTNRETDVTWETTESHSDGASGGTLVGFDGWGRPALGNTAGWCFLSDQSNSTLGPRNSNINSAYAPNASDFSHEIELLPVDVLIGTWDVRHANPGTPGFNLAGHRLGRFPLARMGHDNHGDFALVEHQAQRWIHITDGVYLPWSGSVMP